MDFDLNSDTKNLNQGIDEKFPSPIDERLSGSLQCTVTHFLQKYSYPSDINLRKGAGSVVNFYFYQCKANLTRSDI